MPLVNKSGIPAQNTITANSNYNLEPHDYKKTSPQTGIARQTDDSFEASVQDKASELFGPTPSSLPSAAAAPIVEAIRHEAPPELSSPPTVAAPPKAVSIREEK